MCGYYVKSRLARRAVKCSLLGCRLFGCPGPIGKEWAECVCACAHARTRACVLAQGYDKALCDRAPATRAGKTSRGSMASLYLPQSGRPNFTANFHQTFQSWGPCQQLEPHQVLIKADCSTSFTVISARDQKANRSVSCDRMLK